MLNTALVFFNTKQVSIDANDICSAGKHCRCKEPLLERKKERKKERKTTTK